MNSNTCSQNYPTVKRDTAEEECLLEKCSDGLEQEVDEERTVEDEARRNRKKEGRKKQTQKESRVKGMDKQVKGEDISLRDLQETTDEDRAEEQEPEIKEKEDKKRTRQDGTRSNQCNVETHATVAEPEIMDEDNENEKNPKDKTMYICENFDHQDCKRCFEILDKNMELRRVKACNHDLSTTKDLPSEEDETLRVFDKTYSKKDTEEYCKCLTNEENESFRASLRSLSTCQDSSRSVTGFPSKRSLTLDLECRICHDTEGQDLISPCHCAGTSKWVHESCIIRWIRHTKTKQCEICTCPIAVKRKKKPIDQVSEIQPR